MNINKECRRVVYQIHNTAVFKNQGGAVLAYFPMYIELQDAPCLVLGGGSIACHKVMVLRDFGALVTVIAPEIHDSIKEADGVECIYREYDGADLEGKVLVVAATDDTAVNRRISEECRTRGILVNAVDQPEDCDFIFPSYIRKGGVVAAFSSGGQSPVVTQYLKRKNETVVTDMVGRMAECLGSLRQTVKDQIPQPWQRKAVYEKILQIGLAEGQVPDESVIQNILKEMEKDGPYEAAENE